MSDEKKEAVLSAIDQAVNEAIAEYGETLYTLAWIGVGVFAVLIVKIALALCN